jgi:Terminase small subunit
MEAIIPLMPELGELPPELRDMRDARRRMFVWNYVFNGSNGSAAAILAGYSNASEAAKVTAHHLLQRDDVQAAIKALCGRYLFSLAPKAIMRLGEILDNPKHGKHTKAIEMVLDRTGHAAASDVNVNLQGEVTVNHQDAALENLRSLLGMGVPREKLIEMFGFSGLTRYEKMLAEQDRRSGKLIEGTAERG